MKMKQTTMKHWEKKPGANVQDCYLEIRCFYKFGGHALQVLPKVLPNIFKHFKIDDLTTQEKILSMAQK